jgi:erythromycin esterase-like protein
MERMQAPAARQGSWEDLLHRTGIDHQLLLMDDLRHVEGTDSPRGHRAIGVVYHPSHEAGNYVPSVLPERYDAFLFFDETEALHPLHLQPELTEPPETYPWGV